MSFPLKDWIDDHPHVRHNLSLSGMGRELRSYAPVVRRPRPDDPAALRDELARAHGVPSDRLFLTHGATEGNTAVLVFLAQQLRQSAAGRPPAWLPAPEYPPLLEIARWAGFEVATSPRGVVVLSEPNNPTGLARAPEEVEGLADRVDHLLLDETFREFTTARSWATRALENVWTTGTFTKAYGGDDLRVGFVIAPGASAERFARFHGVALDGLALSSVGAARALLAARTKVLGEARSILRANIAALRRRFPEAPSLVAPVWFDRGFGSFDGDGFARRLLRRSVLVSPGSFFGEPGGVRLCLTRRSFPRDLAVYAAARARWVSQTR